MANVLGSNSYLTIPDVNGDPLTVSDGGSVPAIMAGTGIPSAVPSYGSGTVYFDITNWITFIYESGVWRSLGITAVSGTTNQISATTTSGATTVGLATDPIIPGNASMTIPLGSTAQRPTATDGMIRYNSTLDRMETSESGTWVLNSGTLDKSVVTVTSTVAAATTLFTYTVPVNTMNTDGILKLAMQGWWSNASGAARTMTFLVSFGGTTIWSTITPSLATGTKTAWQLELFLGSNNSTTSQTLTGNVSFGPIGNTTVAPTTGSGPISATGFGGAGIYGTSAINTATTAGVFLVTVASSGTNSGFIKQFHVLSKI